MNMNDKIIRQQEALHRSWLRLLPFTACGALLISLKSASSINSIVTIYGLLIIAQMSVAAIYIVAAKLNAKNKR